MGGSRFSSALVEAQLFLAAVKYFEVLAVNLCSFLNQFLHVHVTYNAGTLFLSMNANTCLSPPSRITFL